MQARAKQATAAAGSSTSSSIGPVTATVSSSSYTEHAESSFDMEPMTIPQTSAVAKITTIGVHCWGTFPIWILYSECQVAVEGDVYPKEAFDPGNAEP